jgi:hypothetical protein
MSLLQKQILQKELFTAPQVHAWEVTTQTNHAVLQMPKMQQGLLEVVASSSPLRANIRRQSQGCGPSRSFFKLSQL